MRLSAPIIAILLVSSAAAIAQSASPVSFLFPPDPNEWSPDAGTIARVDALALHFRLPRKYERLRDYTRYYFGSVEDGHKVVVGTFVSPRLAKEEFHEPKVGQIHIYAEKLVPKAMGGGCEFVGVLYQVEDGKIAESCNSPK